MVNNKNSNIKSYKTVPVNMNYKYKRISYVQSAYIFILLVEEIITLLQFEVQYVVSSPNRPGPKSKLHIWLEHLFHPQDLSFLSLVQHAGQSLRICVLTSGRHL